MLPGIRKMLLEIKKGLKWQVINAKNAEKHGTDGLNRIFARIVMASWKRSKRKK